MRPPTTANIDRLPPNRPTNPLKNQHMNALIHRASRIPELLESFKIASKWIEKDIRKVLQCCLTGVSEGCFERSFKETWKGFENRNGAWKVIDKCLATASKRLRSGFLNPKGVGNGSRWLLPMCLNGCSEGGGDWKIIPRGFGRNLDASNGFERGFEMCFGSAN